MLYLLDSFDQYPRNNRGIYWYIEKGHCTNWFQNLYWILCFQALEWQVVLLHFAQSLLLPTLFLLRSWHSLTVLWKVKITVSKKVFNIILYILPIIKMRQQQDEFKRFMLSRVHGKYALSSTYCRAHLYRRRQLGIFSIAPLSFINFNESLTFRRKCHQRCPADVLFFSFTYP